MIRIGVDFGGSKIEAAALDGGGRFLARRRVRTPHGYSAAIEAIRGLVVEVEAEVGACASVGVGAPGSASPDTGAMRNANAVWLNGRPFRADLEAALRRPVRLANDADCLALSEATDGAGAGAATVFAIVLGTGCGGGLVRDRALMVGANGLAGEWGHLPLPWARADERPGPACWCGRRGCLETWVAGPALARDHLTATGRDVTPEAIVAAADAGDADAAFSLDRLTERLARGLAMICEIVDPDVFVFGGGLSNVARLYPRVEAALARRLLGGGFRGRLLSARWGDSSGVRGAARLWGDADAS